MSATQFTFEAIGTQWQIDIPDVLQPARLDEIKSSILNRIEEFDQAYSRFRSDSLVVEMATKSGTYELPPDAKPMMELYHQLYQLTDGLFTPLIGQVMVDAGYDAEYSLQQHKPLERPLSWEEVIAYDGKSLSLTPPSLLDFGAAGKGYLIDLVSDVLELESQHMYTIDAGGDIIHHDPSKKRIRVGLENPANTQQVIGVCNLQNASICGSAGNRRVWEQFHHIIDPKLLTSPRQILATWVVASSAMVADALATALYFKPAAILRQQFEFEYVTLRSDFKVEKSQNFPGELFII